MQSANTSTPLLLVTSNKLQTPPSSWATLVLKNLIKSLNNTNNNNNVVTSRSLEPLPLQLEVAAEVPEVAELQSLPVQNDLV